MASYQLKIIATYSDNSTKDVSNEFDWSSSDTNLATVSSSGLVSTKDINTSTSVEIFYESYEKANDGSAIFGGSKVFTLQNIDIESVRLEPSSTIYLDIGQTSSIKAIATYVDGSVANITDYSTWSSSDGSVATVDSGVVTALKEGNITITASSNKFNDKSDSVDVNVIKTTYKSLELRADTTSFNVEQNIELELFGTTDNNTTVLLSDSELVKWDSSETDIVSISGNMAEALEKGQSDITASITFENNATIKDTITLSVLRDEYIRIFKDNQEIELPYVKILEEELDESEEFTLKAVGKDFKISDLIVRDINGTEILYGAYFDGLEDGDDLFYEEDNITFTLNRDYDTIDWVEFYFKVDDEYNSIFSLKYKESEN